ncbi:hypothetical protein MJD09_14925, partial [bacterium]|nr:hypothetical protein [bacterium]
WRPHWGQINSLTGSNGFIKSMYPAYDKWMDVHNQLSTKGTFSGPFSERVGISKRTFRTIP